MAYVISTCIVFLQYRKEESNNLNVRWPLVAPSCPSPVLGLGMKLIYQGGLHNHGNDDTHTCSARIETKSRLNLTIYDSSS